MLVGTVEKYIVGLNLHHALCHARSIGLPRSVVEVLTPMIPRLPRVG